MFLLLSALALAETQAEVREILIGNWTANCTTLAGDASLPDHFLVQIEETDAKSTISIRVFEDANAPLPIRQFIAVFNTSSKGKFSLMKGSAVTASFDFSPRLPPHIFSSGPWGNRHFYTAGMFTNKAMQLSLFANDRAEWHVIDFAKEDTEGELPWYETYFKLIFMGIVFLGSWGVSMAVQKCVVKKRMREAEEILRREAAQKKRVH